MTQSTISAEHSAFRMDINGLRALAVTAVVLFHFGLGGLNGGFSGVDVFFVISGFLMSGIIVSGLQQQRFSILSFYWARARRILPALIVVCVAMLIVGWVLLAPSDYKTLGRHARQSLILLSNLIYPKEAGYFDGVSQGKWLLHIWSLSVEWQYYLLLPLILAATWRLLPSRRAMTAVHLGLLLASFATCVALTRSNPVEAFYFLQSRAWEMLLGGLCWLLGATPRLPLLARRSLEVGGLLLIVGSAFVLDSADAWPGFLALLPTLGTAMVLLARQEHSLWSNNRVVGWLGSRSYSLYLWHWPLVAGLFYFYRQDNAAWIAAALLLTLLLGELSYRLIEQPCRRSLQRWRQPWAAIGLLGLVAMLSNGANQVVRHDGFLQRMPADILAMLEAAKIKKPHVQECLEEGAPCTFGDARIGLMVIGDSHASAVLNAAVEALATKNQGVFIHAAAGCVPITGLQLRLHPAEKPNDPCNTMRAQLPAELAERDSHIPLVIVNRITSYVFGFDSLNRPEKSRPEVFLSKPMDKVTPEFLQQFADLYVNEACSLAKTRPVYLMRPIPEMPVDVPDVMLKAMWQGKSRPQEVTRRRDEYRARNDYIWQVQDRAHEQCGVGILDPLPYLCDDQVCYGSKNGIALYEDDNHLNLNGSALLIPMFAKAFAAGHLPKAAVNGSIHAP